MTATILPFPTFPRPLVLPKPRTVTLLALSSDAVWATAGFLPGDPGAPWAWICEVVAREVGCSEEEVGTAEGDDGDVVTAEGIPICRVEIGGRSAPLGTGP